MPVVVLSYIISTTIYTTSKVIITSKNLAEVAVWKDQKPRRLQYGAVVVEVAIIVDKKFPWMITGGVTQKQYIFFL